MAESPALRRSNGEAGWLQGCVINTRATATLQAPTTLLALSSPSQLCFSLRVTKLLQKIPPPSPLLQELALSPSPRENAVTMANFNSPLPEGLALARREGCRREEEGGRQRVCGSEGKEYAKGDSWFSTGHRKAS